MLTMTRRIRGACSRVWCWLFSGSTMGCGWFPESTFELASESRLPKWITLPPDLLAPMFHLA